MLWCGPCNCRTLQCWRYANENCGCWEANLFSNIAVNVSGGEASVVLTYKWNEYATTITLWNPVIVAEVVYTDGNEADANEVKSKLEGLSIDESATSEEIIALINNI